MSSSTSPSPRGVKCFILVSAVSIFALSLMAFSSHIELHTRLLETASKRFQMINFHNAITPKYMQPVCKDCYKPNWFRPNYTGVFGNYVFPEPNCDGKLLVYECAVGLCGGLGDREKGIMSSFLLALLTDRTFVIDHRKPCDIKKFLEPNLYDWSKCLQNVSNARLKGQRTVTYIDGRGHLPDDFSVLKQGDLWMEHVITIRINIRLQPRIKNHPGAPQMMPWLMDSSQESVVTGLMHALFKPELTLESHLRQFVTEQTRNGTRQLVAVHIRSAFLKNEADVPIVFKFLENFSDKEKYCLYIASDNITVRNQAKQRFDNFASVNREIIHIDHSHKPCEGVYTAVFEQQILSRGDILVMTPSGFSRLAAYIRGSSDNMFVLETNESVSNAKYIQKVELDYFPSLYPES